MSEKPDATAATGVSPLDDHPPPPLSTTVPEAALDTSTSSASKKKKNKKKKKKNAGSISVASGAGLESEEPSPAGTPTTDKSPAELEEAISTIAHPPERESVAPVPEPIAEASAIDFSASPTVKALDSSPATSLLPADEEQPDFGAHSSPTDAAHVPTPGVPAPMPPHASSLFADDAEDSAFEFSTDPVNEWEVQNPATPDHLMAYDSSALQAQPEHVPAEAKTEQPPFVHNDIDEGAFESTATLDAAIDAQGERDETNAVIRQAEESCAASHPASLFTEDHGDFDIGMRHDHDHERAPEPVVAERPAESTAAASNDVVSSYPTSQGMSSHTAAASLFQDDAEAIAFDIPTETEILEGAEGEDLATKSLPKPMSHAAASLFADEAEGMAFDIGYGDVDTGVEVQEARKEQAKEAKEEPKEEAKAKKASPAPAPALTAQALFADDDSGAFDIPTQDDSAAQSAPAATTQPHTIPSAAPMNAAALFADDTDAFDIGVPEPEAAPARTAAQQPAASAPSKGKTSMSSLASSDFLVDTTFDDSFNLGRDDEGPLSPPMEHIEPPADFDVPEGWYDDAGNFNWYTPEEKEAVRQAMIGDPSYGLSQKENDTRRSTEPAADPYAPAAAAAATPYAPPANPYAPAAASVPPANPYAQPAPANPYAPATAPQANPYAPAPAAQASSYAPAAVAQASPYAPAQGYAAYQPPAPAAASTGLYTPGFQQAAALAAAPAAAAVGYGAQGYDSAPAPYDPYAPQATGYGATASPYSATAAPYSAGPSKTPTSPKVEPPKRMKATAYDAPFLNRPPKSRQTSHSQPAPVEPFVVPSNAPPMPAMPPAPPAPPPGPPKRSSTMERVPGVVSPTAPHGDHQAQDRFPSMVQPAGPPRSKSTAATMESYAPTNAYDPPVRALSPPSAHAGAYTATGYGAADAYAPQRPVSPPTKPPQRPATASSTHPPKPTSFDPPIRMSTSRPPSRHASKPDFASPPPMQAGLPPVPPIPKEYAYGAPKSAGAQSPPKPPYASFSPPPPPPKAVGASAPPPKAFSPPPKAASPPPPPPKAPQVSAPPQAAPPPPQVAPPPAQAAPPPPKAMPPPPKAMTPPPAAHAGFAPPPKTGTPPPRPPSAGRRAVSHGAPPRVSSPLRHESANSMSLTEAAEAIQSPPKKQALGLHEEVDPEGGEGGWESVSYGNAAGDRGGYEPTPYTPPAAEQQQGYEPAPYVPEPTKESSGYEPYKAPADESSDYEPYTAPAPTSPKVARDVNAYAPASPTKQAHPAPPTEYNPYAPSSPQATKSDPYAPPSPTKQARHAPPAEYNPYAPSSPQAAKRELYAPSSPTKQAHPAPPPVEYNAYGPASPKQSQTQTQAEYNPYAPSSPKAATGQTAEYNPYGAPSSAKSQPTEYNPYGPPSAAPTQASAEYNPYGPPSAAKPHPAAEHKDTSPKAAAQPPADEYNPYAPRQSGDYSRKSGEYGRKSGEYGRTSGEYGRPSFESTAPTHERKSSAASGYQPYSANAYAPTNEYNPYAPTSPPTTAGHLGRQASISSSPYVPAKPPAPGTDGFYSPANMYGGQRTASPPQEFGGMSPPQNNYFQNMHFDPTYVPQQVLEQRPVSEDPLGRCSSAARNVPIARFGFGGWLITGFPGAANDSAETPTYGYGSYRGLLNVRPVSEVVESSAISSNETAFPGPLIFAPATAKGAVGDKKRRESVLAYLAARAEEIERGLPYLKSSASRARREEEAKLAIVRILTAFVEGDGRPFGNPKAEEALRAALQPPAAGAAVAPTTNGLGVSTVPGGRATASQLAQLSTMIMTGDKRDAAQFAAQAGLWSHALVISSSVDPELWREIVTRFAASELGGESATAGLKAAYTVYAGLTPANIDDLFKAAHITDDPSADQWREVVGAVLFNGKPTDLICLDDLGARFKKAGLVSASHVCALLSPNSPFSDLSPAAADRPIVLLENEADDDALIFAEIAEYARTLVPTPKGAEAPPPAMAQLLPYKLRRAWRAAELGNVDEARAYCEAIGTATEVTEKDKSRRLAPHLVAGLEDLLERLSGEPSVAPTKGQRTLAVRKAKSSATLGSWIEGRLTKFIAGEEDGDAKPEGLTVKKEGAVGPFSHFSAITPSPAPSASVSRAVSSVDMHAPPSTGSVEPPTPYAPTSAGYSSYQPWGGSDDATTDADATPHVVPAVPTLNVSDDGFINPMGNLSFGTPTPAQDYTPPARHEPPAFEDDEDDLGFGNTALSRGRTPQAADNDKENDKDKYAPPPKAEEKKPEPKKEDKPAAKESKGSWLGKWWGGKKEAPSDGHGTGYTRANLGEEMKMVYDPELKRYVMKGQKPEPAAAAPPPPPPRAQTASPTGTTRPPPAARASTATPRAPPPIPSRAGSGPPPSGPPAAGPPSGGPPSAASSRPPSGMPPSRPPSGPAGGPPRSAAGSVTGLPSASAASATPSLDDLLSRPASGRPTSAAAKKKGRAANKYVDVFQQ